MATTCVSETESVHTNIYGRKELVSSSEVKLSLSLCRLHNEILKQQTWHMHTPYICVMFIHIPIYEQKQALLVKHEPCKNN